MVKINGTNGFIRSDYLMYPIGDSPATFRTTGGLRLRSSPSTEARVVTTVGPGAEVDVHKHDPAGWSSVTINGTAGYIRSDLLVRPIQTTTQTANATASAPAATRTSAPTTMRTTGGVRLRSGPSTEANIVTVIGEGVSVQVLEYNQTGWSKVSVSGHTGYIRSDLLTTGGRNVELLEWSEARHLIRNGVPMQIVDVRTGITFNLVSFSRGRHADVEPPTRADTDAILRSRGGVWAWAPRPVWVTIGNRTIAASLNGMPHAGSTIATNGMNGHLCLHFAGTVTNNKSYQNDLRNAVMEAYNAAR